MFARYFTVILLLSLFVSSKLMAKPLGGPKSDYDEDEKAMRQYLQQHQALAIEEMLNTGIPASVKLAQAALESACGTSELARYANNHFGIKADNNTWKGETYYKTTQEQTSQNQTSQELACFRSYPTVADSYRDHSNLLQTRSHYRKLFDANTLDYNFWCKELFKAGYATDRNYANKLIGLIEKYQLYLIDQEHAKKYNLPTASFPENNPQLAITDLERTNRMYEQMNETRGRVETLESQIAALKRQIEQQKNLHSSEIERLQEQILLLDQRLAEAYEDRASIEARITKLEIQQQALYKSDPLAQHFDSEGKPRSPQFYRALEPNREGFSYRSGKRVVALGPNSNLQQIALHFQVDYQKLLRYNDIEDEFMPLPQGFYVYLEPKAHSHHEVGEQATHKVRQGETMHDIAQLYGIQLSRLLDRNQLKKGEEPANGEEIFLNRKNNRRPALRQLHEGQLGGASSDFGAGGR